MIRNRILIGDRTSGDVNAILEESQAALERATRLEEAVGALLPDYVNLRSQARALVEAARAFSRGLKVATVPLMETVETAETTETMETTDTMEPTETTETTETMEASAAQPAPSLGESTAPEEAGPPPAGAEETAGVEAIEAIETAEASRTAEGPRGSEEAEASEEARETRETREAREIREAEKPEEPEETEEPRAVTLAGSLREIATVIEQDNLVVDVNDYRFAEKAQGLIPKNLEGALGTDAGGKKAARILFDCVRFMDVLDRDYSLPGYERLGQLVGRLRREVAEFLKESFDIEFSPDPCVPDSESPAALAKLEAERVNFPSAEPAGRVLAVLRRGAIVRSSPNGPDGAGGPRDRLTGPPKLLVSAGSATPVFTLVYNVARAVLAPAKLPEKPRQARAVAAKEIRRKYLLQLVDAASKGDADREATVLRYVANLLQAQNGTGQLDSLQRPLLAALEERGFKTVSVRMGGTFDDSYSTGKYERKSVPSSQPKGTIVGVLQIGFVNRDGVPVQKATVGVSSGMGT